MKTYKQTIIFMAVFVMAFMSACALPNDGTDDKTSDLSKVWTVTSEHIKTDFDSKISHTSVVSLDMKLTSVGPSREKIAFGSFINGSLGLRIFKKEAAEKWAWSGMTPLMIVSDRPDFKKELISIVVHEYNEKKFIPKWSLVPFDSRKKHDLWWLVIPNLSGNNNYAQIKLRKDIKNRKGYFSSFQATVPQDALVKNISGCVRFPWDMHFSTQIGTDMHIRLLKQTSGRVYGFCYKNEAYKKDASGNGHYIAVSTADGWSDVAMSMHRAYQHAESRKHKLLMSVIAKINFAGTSGHREKAINRARYWVVNNLQYSAAHPLLNAPHTFDEVLKNKGGVCTDLTLVLTMLLRKIGVVAHPALTSATFRDAFKHNAADLSKIDHMVVYLPKLRLYLDPDNIHPSASFTHIKRQLLDVVNGKIVAVPEAPFPVNQHSFIDAD